jgi:large subunit ribosomal protein L20
MVRIKGGIASQKRRKHLLKYTKGYTWGRKNKLTAARTALMHAWEYAFRDRKAKKREFRRLWELQINAACRKLGLSYSKFTNGLKKNKIIIDRKILSVMTLEQPEIFKKIVEKVKG